MSHLVRARAFQAACLGLLAGGSFAAAEPPAAERVAPEPAPAARVVVGAFSTAEAGGPLPEGWRPLEFRRIDRKTQYELVDDGGEVVVRAESRAGASGLTRSIDLDPATHPILSWRWRTAGVLVGGDVTRKQGDDYPARVYVAFGYDAARVGFLEQMEYEALRMIYGEYPPLAAISYVWASNSPVGTIVPNAYSDRVRMIVVESGAARVGGWQRVRRDIEADYALAFGGAPPRISGVAIMTDTDDTGESATSWFGDIFFGARPGPPDRPLPTAAYPE